MTMCISWISHTLPKLLRQPFPLISDAGASARIAAYIRMIDANVFDFSNGSESWNLDVSADVKDDVTGSFTEYSPDIKGE
jgi:hypothetical protein